MRSRLYTRLETPFGVVPSTCTRSPKLVTSLRCERRIAASSDTLPTEPRAMRHSSRPMLCAAQSFAHASKSKGSSSADLSSLHRGSDASSLLVAARKARRGEMVMMGAVHHSAPRKALGMYGPAIPTIGPAKSDETVACAREAQNPGSQSREACATESRLS